MNEQTSQKTIHRGNRRVASAAAGFFKVAGLRRAIDTRKQIIVRRARPARPERDQERGFEPSTQNHGSARVDKQGHALRCCERTREIWIAGAKQKRRPERLLTFRLHTFPSGLRSVQIGHQPWSVPRDRLHGLSANSRPCSNGRKPCGMETGQKIRNTIPATEQSTGETFRCGTKSGQETAQITDFVPPRYKTPHFWGWLRSATGHLFIFTISQGFCCGSSCRCWV